MFTKTPSLSESAYIRKLSKNALGFVLLHFLSALITRCAAVYIEPKRRHAMCQAGTCGNEMLVIAELRAPKARARSPIDNRFW